ncbi:MAG: hypothetical protein methR_P1017 [Methyloprofundus sp.]|nr:MAG: hypothetical protein methR_P1017 [Methyloprofundus sp.]
MTDEYNILFGRRLAEIRKEKGVAQDKLALKCDIARSFVGEVERGKRNLSLRNICKLAIGLEVTTAELLSLIDEEISKEKS